MEMGDVLIIGAGPAGCAAAILLTHARREVTLIEQHRFPRDKVCGECLSALGYEVLTRLNLTEAFHQASPVRLSRTLLHPPAGPPLSAALPRPMWGISRARFDSLLLHQAAQAGAKVMQPARCEAVRGGELVEVQIRDLESNAVEIMRPKWVLLAEGKGALLDQPAALTGDFGIKTHFEQVDGPRDAIELFSTAGRYGGLAAIEGGRWNAAFSVRAEDLRRHHGDVEALFAEITSANAALADRLAGSVRAGDWLAAPLPRYGVRRRWPRGVIPLGNAAAAIEPIGGEGMGLAMRSAELAAMRLLEDHKRDHQAIQDDVRKGYQSLWRIRRPACRAAAVALSSQRWSQTLAPLLHTSPLLLRAGMALAGK